MTSEIKEAVEVNAHALTVFNRPEAREAEIPFTLTPEQVTAREEFVRALTAMLAPDRLRSLGAFITPGKTKTDAKGKEYTPIMLALSIAMPELEFVNPDGEQESTRKWAFSINAILPPEPTKPQAEGAAPLKALTYSELRKLQLKK